jgi:hypothetical protein
VEVLKERAEVMSDDLEWIEILRTALKGLGDYISAFAKKLTLSAVVKDLDKAVKTGAGIKDFLDERKELDSRREVAKRLSNILLELRFDESGIRSKIRELLLNPSAEAEAALDRALDDRLELVKRTVTDARSDKDFAAEHADLIDRVMISIQDKKMKFYNVMLTNQAKFHRALQRYRQNPTKVSLEERRKIAAELEVFFDLINNNIQETRKEIAEFLKTTD